SRWPPHHYNNNLQHFGDHIHHEADLPAIVLQDHCAGVVAHGCRNSEPFAEVDHGNGGPFIPQHAFEELRRLREGRRTLVPEDPLHLEDVEGEVLAGHPERHQLDIIARAHWIRSPSASRSSIGTRPPSRRPMPDAHGNDSPGGTGRGASRTTSSASSTSNSTSRPPMVTSTIAPPRSAGGV